jgi:hypothetical protein
MICPIPFSFSLGHRDRLFKPLAFGPKINVINDVRLSIAMLRSKVGAHIQNTA